MGGGGTTYSVTEMPSEVQNLLGSSASKIGGMQNSDALNIGNFFGANPQQTAGLSSYYDWAGGQGFMNTGKRPAMEDTAWGMAQYLPGQVGVTPGAFRNATGQRPQASQMSMDFLPSLQGTAGEVSSRYYTGPSPWEQHAGNVALQATPYAGQALAAFDPVRQQAGQTSQRYFQGMTPQEQQAWELANRAGMRAETAVMEFDPVMGFASQVNPQFQQLAQQAQLEGRFLAPTGANLGMSPSLAAAQQAFQHNIQPGIENQAAAAGLGRSTALTNSLASAEAQYMLPLVQEELNREFQGNMARYQALQDVGLQSALASERGIERGANVGLQRAQAAQGVSQNLLGSSQMLGQLGQQSLARELQAAQAEERGIERASNIGLQQAMAAQNIPQTMLASSQMLNQLGQQDAARQLEAANAEERGTVRRTQAIETAINTLQAQGQQDLARQLEQATAEERALSRYGESTATSMQALLGLGGAETARAQQQYGNALQLDELYRNQAQQQYDAQYNDYLRRQALSEQSLFGPLGQIIPSAFGQRVSQSGGGMFK